MITLSSFLRDWPRWIALTILGGALALAVSMMLPQRYSSTVRVLVTQTKVPANIDPYTTIKFTERLAANLGELIYTSNLARQIISHAPNFDATYFPSEEYKWRKAWRKTVGVGVSPGTGIMTIVVYHPEVQQANILTQAIAKELVSEAPLFFGENIRVQIVDTPLGSPWPVQPSVPKNILFGFFLGFVAGAAWTVVRRRR